MSISYFDTFAGFRHSALSEYATHNYEREAGLCPFGSDTVVRIPLAIPVIGKYLLRDEFDDFWATNIPTLICDGVGYMIRRNEKGGWRTIRKDIDTPSDTSSSYLQGPLPLFDTGVRLESLGKDRWRVFKDREPIGTITDPESKLRRPPNIGFLKANGWTPGSKSGTWRCSDGVLRMHDLLLGENTSADRAEETPAATGAHDTTPAKHYPDYFLDFFPGPP